MIKGRGERDGGPRAALHPPASRVIDFAAVMARLDEELLRVLSVPPPRVGPAPTPCPACGREWRGLAYDGISRYAVCCGAARSALLEMVGP